MNLSFSLVRAVGCFSNPDDVVQAVLFGLSDLQWLTICRAPFICGYLLFTQYVVVSLLISGFLSEGVASCVSTGLMCPWEEVHSGAFCVPSCTGTLSRSCCQSSSYMKTFSESSSPQQQSFGASYIFSFISCSEHTAFRMRYLNISPSAEPQLSKGPQHPWSPLNGSMPYREPFVKVPECNLGEGKL